MKKQERRNHEHLMSQRLGMFNEWKQTARLSNTSCAEIIIIQIHIGTRHSTTSYLRQKIILVLKTPVLPWF